MQLVIEPELQTNQPRKRLLHSEAPEERVYEPEGVGIMLRKGDEVVFLSWKIYAHSVVLKFKFLKSYHIYVSPLSRILFQLL